jgi:8-hydroxy-5-deazaflavin:NADPH oxidoreductase
MRLGIPGSGLMGGKPGTPFARAGHEAGQSYSRSPSKRKGLARDLTPAPGGSPGRSSRPLS